jgi:hypothetical protein
MNARMLLGVLVAIVVMGCEAAPTPTTPRDSGPHVGDPCRRLHEYPVTFTSTPDGSVQSHFAFAGGALHGSLSVPSADIRMIATHDAFVTDVQLGSYEPAGAADASGGLTCRLNPTYHFFCPSTATLDQICYTWVARLLAVKSVTLAGSRAKLAQSGPSRHRVLSS